MAKWNTDNVLLTQKGREVLSKVQAGIGKITVTRIMTGGGYVSPSQLYAQTAVTNEKQQADIIEVSTTADGSSIEIQINNSGLTEEYSLYQIGIYVTHPDFVGEVLYMIAQCDTTAPDRIPLPSETPVALNYSLYMTHSGTSQVTITVSPAGAITPQIFDAFKQIVNTHMADTNIHTSTTEKTTISNHIANGDIHTSVEEKESFLNKYTKEESDDLLAGKTNTDFSNMNQDAFEKAIANSGAGCVSIITTGSGSAYLASATGVTLKDGLIAKVKFHADMQAGATFNFNDTGAKAIIDAGGNPIQGGIKAGNYATLVYNGINWVLQGGGSGSIPSNKFRIKVAVISFDGGEISGRTLSFSSDSWSEPEIGITDSTGVATVEFDLVATTVTVSMTDVPRGYGKPADVTLTPVGGTEFNVNFFMPEKLFTIYGVRIAKANSNPVTSVEYTDDAVGLTPSSCSGTTFTDNGWQARLENIVGMRPCMLKNGVVQYYLNPDDFTKKADGTDADITSGDDGDVMIEFNKCWLHISSDADYTYVKIANEPEEGFSDYPFSYKGVVKDKFYIGVYKGCMLSNKLRSLSGKTPVTNQTIATFRGYAQANGAGYELVPFNKLILLQALYLIRFKSLDSQSALGRGNVDSSSLKNTGATNTRGMCYGNTATSDDQIKCNGIEDFWGNIWEWIDGLSTNESKQILTQDGNFSDNAGTNRKTFSANYSGYIQDVCATPELGFLALEGKTSGSETTYYCDIGYVHSACVTYFGGHWSNGSNAGVFQLSMNNTASYSYANIGGRLAFCG